MMNNLSIRQQALIKVCKKSDITCDVGCDHGYIGSNLLQNKKTKFLIATDISKPSVMKTDKLLRKNNLIQKASIRVGDGLQTINKNEFPDQIIVAGMGGKEITHILSEYKNISKTKHFVFQPMNELLHFRKYLSENNIKIQKDIVIFDKKFYHIITAVPAKNCTLSPFKQKWGAKTKNRTKDYYLWLNEKKQKLLKILSGLPKNNEKEKHIKSCLKDIEKIEATKGAKTC